jgi:hypothetical protein
MEVFKPWELGIGNWVRGKSFSRKTFASHWELGIGNRDCRLKDAQA